LPEVTPNPSPNPNTEGSKERVGRQRLTLTLTLTLTLKAAREELVARDKRGAGDLVFKTGFVDVYDMGKVACCTLDSATRPLARPSWILSPDP
jgi:hypothetical protein